MKQVSYSVEKCLKANVTVPGFNDLSVFLAELLELDKTASKQTHYEKLDDWLVPVYKLVRQRLKNFGFINGGAAHGIKQPTDADFWFLVYGVVNNVCYSPNLETQVSHHHSSAWERSQALIKDIQDIIEFKSSVTIMK